MSKRVVTNSFEETQELGKEFAKQEKLQVLALHGDLGSGKTTFVQGLARGLGITKKIISPTFIIVRTYELQSHPTKTHFYHVDLYRIESEKDVEGLGLLELMQDPKNIVVIEWPEKIENLLPENRQDMFFTYLEDDRRNIVFE